MEMKHIKLLLAPCPNASQADLQIILCLSFYFTGKEERRMLAMPISLIQKHLDPVPQSCISPCI